MKNGPPKTGHRLVRRRHPVMRGGEPELFRAAWHVGDRCVVYMWDPSTERHSYLRISRAVFKAEFEVVP